MTDGDSVIFSSYDGHVYKMAVEDKKMQWIFPSEAAEELPGPPTHPKVKAYIAAMADYSKKVAECAAQAEAAQAEGKALEQPCEPGDEPAAPSSEQGAEWEWPPADFAYSSPMRVGNLIILGNMDWNVYALNADTGELVWRTRLNGTVTSSAVAGDGVIYIGSNGRLGGKSPEDGRLYALDAKTGKILNNFQAKNEVNSSVRVNGTRCTSATSPGTCTVWTPRRSKRSGRSKPTPFEGAQRSTRISSLLVRALATTKCTRCQDDGKVCGSTRRAVKSNRIL